ncbi:RNA-binding protein 2 isoform X3 [Cucumis sativus]|uniref:RNA-binding protein 2 isoform X3 n=1 Tax=Cucumis sativus TaxID=3659 RepID=UPI0012F4A45A|nr:RNA-binding protein 2 isoform X3 [Cucumis sativus]
MADDYWNRQQPLLPSPAMLKRPRTDYELPASGLSTGHDMHNYLTSDDRGGPRSVKDTQTIGSAYDRYLQSVQLSSFTSGEVPTHGEMGMGRPVANRMPVGNRMPGPLLPDPIVMSRPPAVSPDLAPNGRNLEYGNHLPVDSMSRPGRETVPLPPDASNTLYVEGLPPDSSRREVAHIFRPFVGYKELRLVSKESKHRGGDPLILCFVDFANPACAATAMSALQGYKMDEQDPESNYLRLQFSRHPGPRSGSGSGGKRNLESSCVLQHTKISLYRWSFHIRIRGTAGIKCFNPVHNGKDEITFFDFLNEKTRRLYTHHTVLMTNHNKIFSFN